MTPNPEVQERLRRYLLGQLVDEAREEIEKDLLAQDEVFEELLMAEDELIDEYLTGELTAVDRAAFESHFLSTPERHDQLRFGRTFDRYLASHAATVPTLQAKTPSSNWAFSKTIFSSPIRIAVFAVVVIGIAFGVWRIFFHQSEVDKGLLALNEAYRQQRPLESRISSLSYAPFSQTRGREPERIDSLARDRAELTLNYEVNNRGGAAAHHALGEVFLAGKRFDEAIAQFEIAFKSDPKNPKLLSDLGAAWLEKGKIDLEGKDPGNGMQELGRSLEHFNKALELSPNLLDALFNRALDYQYLGAAGEAEASWKEYIEKDPNSPWAEEAKRNLKQLQEGRQKSSWNAVNTLQSFLAARDQRNDDDAWKAITQGYRPNGNDVTNALLDAVLEPANQTEINDPSAALSYLAKLELERAGDRYTSDLLNQLERELPLQRPVLIDANRKMRAANTLFINSHYKDAIDTYSEVRRQYEQLGDSTEQLFVEYRMAHCYLFQNLQQAELMFKRLADVCLSREYRWLTAQCSYGLSHASYDQSQYSKAIDYSNQALTRFEHAGDLNGILKSLTQLAQTNQTLNRIDHAFKYLSRALSLGAGAPLDPMAKWGMFVQVGFDMSSKELHDAALIYQKEALEVALTMKKPLITSRSYDYLGSEYAAVKRYADGVEAARQAMATGEAMSTSPGGMAIIAHASQQLGDIHRQSGDCEKAIHDYDKSIEIYRTLKVEYYSYDAHKGKLICFIANNDDRAAGEELTQVMARFGEYRSKITDESQRVSFFANQQGVYDAAMYYESARARDFNKAFAYSEDSRARTFLDEIREGVQVLEKNGELEVGLPAVTKTMSLEKIQESMPAESQILQYAVLDDRLLIWVVTRTAIHPYQVSLGSEQLNEKVRAFLETVNQPPVGDANEETRSAEDLYRILIAPVEPFLDKSKYLCIVPDKILNYLPYQALVSPVTAHFLIEDYYMGTAPSSTTFIDLTGSAQRKAGKFEEELLSVGNPRFNRVDFDSLPELRSAAREAQTVASLYPKRHLLLSDDATETAVRSEIGNADVAHFAMHYIVNDQMETLSGFPLTPNQGSSDNARANGFLQSHEIYGMGFPRTRLVILSGCQTGIEQQYAGEGAIGAARPFLIAGVPTAVATLWPVDSDASAELMAGFHRHRRGSSPVAQALRSAQIEMARGADAHYRHPYYWAAFQTIGGLSSY
jgi:CHAT domain-containing protein